MNFYTLYINNLKPIGLLDSASSLAKSCSYNSKHNSHLFISDNKLNSSGSNLESRFLCDKNLELSKSPKIEINFWSKINQAARPVSEADTNSHECEMKSHISYSGASGNKHTAVPYAWCELAKKEKNNITNYRSS